MLKRCFYLLASLLIGCASEPRIHIFSLGIEESEVVQLSRMLDQAGFDARVNALPVPSHLFKHTVIFPAIVEDFTNIELVESTLEKAGYANPRLILESESNHHYSTDNIGVYLINPDFEGTAASLLADPYALGKEESNSLSYNYFSECPKGSEAQSELNLYPSNVAILEEFIWDEESNDEKSILHDGEWSADSQTVEISLFKQGELRFAINRHSGSDWFGPFEGLTLVNEYSTVNIESCDYTYLDRPDN